MRAVTVPVNTSTGVAGFVFPGDHVDLVLTQQVERRRRRPAAQGFRDNRAQRPRPRDRPALHRQGRRTARPRSRPFSNVTFEVTPKIAEKIAVAQSLGQLSLSLRSIADNAPTSSVRLPPATSRSRRMPSPAQERQMLLAVADRPIDIEHDLHDRRRRVALPAPHCPRRPAAPAELASGSQPGECRRGRPSGRPAQSSALRAAIMSPSFRWELAKMKTCKQSAAGHASAPPLRRWLSASPPSPLRRSRGAAEGICIGHLSSLDAGPAVGRRRSDAQSAAQRFERLDFEPRSRRRLRQRPAPDEPVRQGGGRSDGDRDRGRRIGRLRRERPGQPEHQLDQRDPASGDAGCRTSASRTSVRSQ